MPKFTKNRRGPKHLFALICLASAGSAGCNAPFPVEQIDLGNPEREVDVSGAERLTDGLRAFEGAAWDSPATARFRSRSSVVEYDLGTNTPIDAIYLQGDNNDMFVVSVSNDGQEFQEVWRAPALDEQGLRARSTTGLRAMGRYVRVQAVGGDLFVTASEFQLFRATPSVWPPNVRPDFNWTSTRTAQALLVLFAILASLWLMFHRASWPTRRTVVAWITVATAFVGAAAAVFNAGASESVVNLLRAVTAFVSLSAVIRLVWHPEGVRQSATTFALAMMALTAMLAFYNLGAPQFKNVAAHGNTYVHTWDMRVYFPIAKYFDELKYDGVYLASVQAFAEEKRRDSLKSIAQTQLRDLDTYQMRTVADLADSIRQVRNRFSDERWAAFKKDMSFFWNTMGEGGYLGSLRDHGGNATPAWLLVAKVLFSGAEANETTFLLSAALDPFLLLLFLVVAWRTFGLRAALLCIIVYGTTTFPQFGSNWAGSTLRNDWMVLLGLGVCALQAKRWMLGGALLGWSAMVRAFPVLVLFFLAVPLVWWIIDRRKPFRAALMPLFKIATGSLLCAGILFVSSSATFGFEASWGQWARKIAMHADKPNVNAVGLRVLLQYAPSQRAASRQEVGNRISDWSALQLETLHERRFVYWSLVVLFTLLAMFAVRRLGWAQTALVGSMMFPVWLYPANYYLHCVFVLPLLGGAYPALNSARTRWGSVNIALLCLCLLQYIGWVIPAHYGRFLLWSAMLLVCFVCIWVALCQDSVSRD